jgi:hypothetical protein
MVTRQRMIDEATRRGYGTGRSLRTTFVNWERHGLIAGAITKAPRRGGEGMWHDGQLWIWLSLLHLRAQGAHLRLLANVPVACWLLGSDGVETGQIQRVMLRFWARPQPPPDAARSPGYRRQLDHAVNWMAVPGAKPGDRHRFRRALGQASAAIPDLGISAHAFADAAADVISPGSEPGPAQASAIRDTYGLLETRALAISQLERLARPTPEVTRFWEWAKRTFQRTWSAYANAQPSLATQPGVGHLYNPLDLTGIELLTWNGCVTTLTVLGIGLELLRSGRMVAVGLERPPVLTWWPEERSAS